MLIGPRSIGRPSANASMRSTSATIRSVSSQIRLVSSRSLSGTDCSRSWAAPRMPDSGFLTSCASMAASALTERAALRCDIWRSMLRAIVCSTSETATSPSLSTIGERRSAQKRVPMRGEASVTPFSATAPPLDLDLLEQREERRVFGHELVQRMADEARAPNAEELFGGKIGVLDEPARIDHHDRFRKRIEDRCRRTARAGRWSA